MKVLVAMSGGVDSSVAAAILVEQGHDVTGATMKLWGGDGDRGCCSVADVDDARRVASQIGISHHVFNFSADFEAAVVAPYVTEHAAGRTPNPCIECNRHLKFDRFLDRALLLGFDAVATGHHARVAAPDGGAGGVGSAGSAGPYRLCRGKDRAKDQSYVLSMLDQRQLARCRFPVGEHTKEEVRATARRLGLATASKPDSQGTCFLPSEHGRRDFLARRAALHRATLVDEAGTALGEVDAVELVTVGQRRGIGPLASADDGARRYVTAVDVALRRVTVGRREDLLVGAVALGGMTWVAGQVRDGTPVLAQSSAHGRTAPAFFETAPADRVAESATLRFREPELRVAPGQTVALYDAASPDSVLGAGIAR